MSETDVDIVTALREWRDGRPLADIAASQGATEQTVYRWIMAAGGKPRKPRRKRAGDDLDTDAIAAEYLSGKTLRRLATDLNVSIHVIIYQLDKAGVQRRPRGENVRRQWDGMWTGGHRGDAKRREKPPQQTTNASRTKPMDVECPRCGAKPGRKCEWRNGIGEVRRMLQPHPARRTASTQCADVAP